MNHLLTRFALTAVLIIAGSAASLAQQRYVSNATGAQSVPPNASELRLVCEALLVPTAMSPSGYVLAVTAIGGTDPLPSGQLGLHRDAGVGQTSVPAFVVAIGGSPGSWSAGFALTNDDITNLRRNRLYLSYTPNSAPILPIRGQIKLANGTYNDYDADGRSDLQVYRSSNNTFYALRSLDGGFIEQPLGSPGDSVSLTVDWDRDGRSDFSTARYNAEALWRIIPSATGILQETRWGSSSLGDFFAAADYDGDGRFDIGIFRAGVWHIIESSTGNFRYEYWGRSGDVPAPNDYDGDGRADLAIARSENGQRVWWIKQSSDGQIRVEIFGLSSDAFFTGRSDFDADAKADILVIRNEGGQRVFYVLRSSDGALQIFRWGLSSDVVKLGDYDGDGRTDPAVTRAVSGQRVFFILQSSNGQPRYETFGLQGDF